MKTDAKLILLIAGMSLTACGASNLTAPVVYGDNGNNNYVAKDVYKDEVTTTNNNYLRKVSNDTTVTDLLLSRKMNNSNYYDYQRNKNREDGIVIKNSSSGSGRILTKLDKEKGQERARAGQYDQSSFDNQGFTPDLLSNDVIKTSKLVDFEEQPQPLQVAMRSNNSNVVLINNQYDNGYYYIIQSGDTAFSLAKNAGISLDKFTNINNIAAPYILTVGQKVYVPARAQVSLQEDIRTGMYKGDMKYNSEQEQYFDARSNSGATYVSNQSVYDKNNLSQRYQKNSSYYEQVNNSQDNYEQVNNSQDNYEQVNNSQDNYAQVNNSQDNYEQVNNSQDNYAQVNNSQDNYEQVNNSQDNYEQVDVDPNYGNRAYNSSVITNGNVANGNNNTYQNNSYQREKVSYMDNNLRETVYLVQENDTLYRISRNFGVEVGRLAMANNLTSPFTISTGQKIIIPSNTKQSIIRASNQRNASYEPNVRKYTSKIESGPAPRHCYINSYGEKTCPRDVSLARKLKSKTSNLPQKFDWPVRGKVIAFFGTNLAGKMNNGINIAVPTGTPVRAVADGKVFYSGDNIDDYGKLVLISHDNDWVTAYAHNDAILVEEGQQVKRGQIISKAGKTGLVNAPQLHFELRKMTKPVDPLTMINKH